MDGDSKLAEKEVSHSGDVAEAVVKSEEPLGGKSKEGTVVGDTEIATEILDLHKDSVYCIPVRQQDSQESTKAPETNISSLEECFQELKVQSSENSLTISSSEEASQFNQNYRKQYGDPSLNFYVGDLKSAYQAACNQPADEKKLLAIYLHHWDSNLTKPFCQQVLKNDEVLTTFKNLFIVYGWDMSRDKNASYFHEQLMDIISDEAAEAARNLKLSQLPAFVIIGVGIDGTIPNIAVIYGDYDDDSLQTRLLLEYSLLSDLYS